MTTLSEEIKRRGLDEKAEIRRLKARASVWKRTDRPKLFVRSLADGTPMTRQERLDADLLSVTSDPHRYAERWAKLNHLKP